MAAGGSCPWKEAPGKKDMSDEIASSYDPKVVEKGWYEWWESSGYFKPRSDFEGDWDEKKVKERGQFTICLPPPNVTGYLHLGHALTATVQDTVIRWRRMRGENVLWIPGTDHAGIATQVVTEKKLKKEEGKSRHDLGREAFLEKVWEVKRSHHAHITRQMRMTGASIDWSREFFTMDDARAGAVKESFVRMYDRGVIKRDTRLINWSCALQSAISDLEVEYIDAEGKGRDEKATGTRLRIPDYEKTIEVGLMYHFYYEVAGSGEKLEVATTRPETILGDTGVAIHPDDKRYKHLHGKKVKCPFRDEEIPLVLDNVLVDMEKGTGVVKVTPAHDPNDFECGKRHKLPQLSMMNKKGEISMPGEFEGMKRFDARKAIVEALKKRGMYVKTEGKVMRIGICSRSKDIIEPMLMPQWFCDCSEQAAKGLKAEQTKQLRLIPENPNAKIWAHWLGNIKPWCISRQLWWGHRIPAYECFMDGRALDQYDAWVVGRTEAEARERAQKKFSLSAADAGKLELRQDPDVLDTWFSSALLPHSALGWPNEEAKDFKQFFPSQLLETGHDILFFWVARMVMSSFEFLDKLPFDTCYLHAMVRDKDGRKMSKSTGNVIDPLDVVNGITLDAMQAKLLLGNLDEREVERAQKNQREMFPKKPKQKGREEGGIPECGSDALKFGLLSYTSSSSRDVNMDTERLVNYRFFCNKLWQAVRYGLYHSLGKEYQPPAVFTEPPLQLPNGTKFVPWAENEMVDANTRILRSRCSGLKVLKDGEKAPPLAVQWILSRLDAAVIGANKHLEAYDFGDAVQAVYGFWYDDFCDWMIECCKAVFRTPREGEIPTPEHILREKEAFKEALYVCLETGLRLLHPMMPFVTEELWNRLPGRKPVASVMVAAYPKPSGWRCTWAEERFKLVQDCTRELRSMKGRYELTDKDRPEVILTCRNDEDVELLKAEYCWIVQAGYTGKVSVEKHTGERPAGCITAVVNAQVQAHMKVTGMNVANELKKLDKKLTLLRKSFEALEKKMAMPTYKDRVPENIRLDNEEKIKALRGEIADVQDTMKVFEEMKAKGA